MQQAIYQLSHDHDDPRMEGFAYADIYEPSVIGPHWNRNERLTDFQPGEHPLKPDWKPPRLTSVWKPLHVKGRVRAFNDHPGLLGPAAAFSQRAVDVLRDILEANGELLPLAYKFGRWWAYNLLTVADIVDVERSTPYDCDRDRPSIRKDFYHFAMHEERIDNLIIFRLRQDVMQTYVTQSFVDRVRVAGLRNFVFNKVWPWPEGTKWFIENKKFQAAERAAGRLADTTRFREHSVVIRLGLDESLRKSAKKRKAAIDPILDQLDTILANPHAPPEAPLIGSLEGDEKVGKEHRLFLSCPDADVLVEKLRPFLRDLDWQGAVVVVKRYGDMRDESAKEETAKGPW